MCCLLHFYFIINLKSKITERKTVSRRYGRYSSHRSSIDCRRCKIQTYFGRACPQAPIAGVLVYFSIEPASFKLSPSGPGRYVVLQVTDSLLCGHQYLISSPIYINSITNRLQWRITVSPMIVNVKGWFGFVYVHKGQNIESCPVADNCSPHCHWQRDH